ncbi:MAG: hypothetical protein JRJ02_03030 [Deltaproteobacteria bacterium]|nr:hypothetical protein [Deltaproteobacteria bacterium]
MTNNTNGNQFRDDEIVIMTHWDKKGEKWVKNVFPKVGGRLRLAHEENEQLSISTTIIKFNENIAVVMAVTSTMKGSFPGYGMASVERDKTIAPAILELAETRAIARSLRFAGYGVEYCSAEEISHLENGNGKAPVPEGMTPSHDNQKQAQGGNGGDGDKTNSRDANGGDNPNGQGNGRLTSKQYKFIIKLSNEKGMTRKELNARCLEAFGVASDYLSKADASNLIEELIGK